MNWSKKEINRDVRKSKVLFKADGNAIGLIFIIDSFVTLVLSLLIGFVVIVVE
jgi:hypothetical protein